LNQVGADFEFAHDVGAGHHDLNQAVACFAFYFGLGKFRLRFFHVFLHLLRLFHQAA